MRLRFPDEGEFVEEYDRAVVEVTRINAREAQRREEERKDKEQAQALTLARQELEQSKRTSNPQTTMALLEDLRRRFPGESSFVKEYANLRAQALTQARQELDQSKREANPQGTLSLLEELRRRFPDASEFAQEYNRTAAEIARIQVRDTERAEIEKKPLPWKLIGGAIAAVAAIAAGVVFVPPLFRSAPVPLAQVEVRTDPPGASVRIGNQTCVTPNCRIELAPGQYSVEAQLKGYEPAQQALTIDRLKKPGPIDLTLQPVAPALTPTQPGRPPAAIGTLVVETGTPNALVFVDNVPRGRTDARGKLPLRLEAAAHEVRVQKPGFQEPREQRIIVAEGTTKTLALSMPAQKATLELRGAPAGVELRLGGTLIGKTNGSVFSVAVPPGDGILQVSDGTSKREVAEKFEPGQTLSIDWPSVAPAQAPKPPQTPTEEALEAQDWDRVRNSSDPAELQNFLTRHRNGAHAQQAQSKLEEAVWSQTNQNDARRYAGTSPVSRAARIPAKRSNGSRMRPGAASIRKINRHCAHSWSNIRIARTGPKHKPWLTSWNGKDSKPSSATSSSNRPIRSPRNNNRASSSRSSRLSTRKHRQFVRP